MKFNQIQDNREQYKVHKDYQFPVC